MSDQLEQFLAIPEEPAAETPEEPEKGEETPAEPAPPAVAEPEKVPVAALLAERHKRQLAEQRAAQLEAAKQAEEKPFLGEEYEQRFQETEQRFQQQLVTQKLDLSESFARDKYEDFEEKLSIFGELCQQNPTLYGQMVAQLNPAEFAYKTASNQLKLKEMSNPEEYEQKLRAKIEAEVKAKYDKEAAKREDLPGSLATARGVAGTQTPAYAGPAPLNDVLGIK